VHVGVDVSVRLPDGTTRTIPWADLRVHPDEASALSSGTHVQIAVGPGGADANAEIPDVSRTPRTGLVPVHFDATGSPLAISAETSGDHLGEYVRQPRVFGEMEPVVFAHPYLCTTPCTLYLRPGGHMLHLSGPGLVPSDSSIVAHEGGDHVVLRSVPMARPFGGLMAAAFGTVMVMGGTFATLIGGLQASSPMTPSSSPTDPAVALGFGIGMFAVGAPLVVLGVRLLVGSRTGVERDAPIEANPSWRTSRRGGVRFTGAGIARTSDGSGVSTGVGFSF
jgi:hypothetical protein